MIDKARHLNKCLPLTIQPESIALHPETDHEFLKIKNELAIIMSDKVGIVRSAEGLEWALSKIESIALQYKETDADYNYHKINNLTDICRIITLSALERKESRGGHVRTDFPVEVEDQLHHIIQEKGKRIENEAVII